MAHSATQNVERPEHSEYPIVYVALYLFCCIIYTHGNLTNPLTPNKVMTSNKVYTPNKLCREMKSHGICISDGNTKLAGIHSFSLPSVITCNGRTALCEKLCYAQKFEKRYKNTRLAYERNLEVIKADIPLWIENMNWFMKEYARAGNKHFRIHVAGDFFNRAYTLAWQEIISANPDITFTVYTRAWRNINLYNRFMKGNKDIVMDILLEMNMYTNTRMFFSTDSSTGMPAIPLSYNLSDIKTAYLMENDTDIPLYPQDIIFRDSRKSVLTKITNGKTICPPENGLPSSKKITCQKCMVCYK